MRMLFLWARHHVWTSRLIIIFLIYPLLNICGWFLGDVLALNEIHISEAWGYPLSFFILILFLIYPFRVDRKYKYYFVWKKSVDALMILTTFCFILMRGNNFNSNVQENVFVTSSYASTAPEASSIKLPKAVKKEKKNFIKKFVHELRKKFKAAKKGDKTGYIILAVLVAVLLLFGLFALTCSIACSGSEGLAYVVFFLGLGGIIFGLVRVIHRITKGPRQKKEPEVKSS